MQTQTSQARIDANRENAQKSHGPVTPEGKAKAALNSVKFGLTGNTVLFLREGDMHRYCFHVDDYIKQFQPVGPEESALVQSIADTRWRLNSIPAIELAILATGGYELTHEGSHYSDPGAEPALEMQIRRRYEKELRNLHLQENRLIRRREREMAELRSLQAERKANEEEALAEAAKATVLAESQNQPLTTSQTPGLGFVFSAERFKKYMSRLTPAQKQKFLQEAIAEEGAPPQTAQAAA